MKNRLFTAVVISLLFLAVSVTVKAEAFSAFITAAQEVPTNGSTATGWGRLIYDETTQTLSWTVFYTGLTSDQTMAHIHAGAGIGANAGVALSLGVVGGTTGTITGSMVISSTLRDQIRAHQAYINIHTVNNPGGEIRGQLGLRRPLDYDGDGKTDYSILRFPAGPPQPITYWNRNSSGFAANQTIQWGDASSDFPAPGDYDGDGKDDLTVYRAGASTGLPSTFWIYFTSTNTFQTVQFGLSGDQAVARDYDGDGKTDIAIFRRGTLSADPTTWWILQSSNGMTRTERFGLTGNGTSQFDNPVPGDYDGDGKFDIGVYRFGLSPANTFIIKRSSDSVVTFQQWGNFNTDFIAPGDYDGDGKFDLCAVRTGAAGSPYTWWIKRSSDGGTRIQQFGISAAAFADFDLPTQGDYDGDGVTDISIWRPKNSGNDSAYFTLGSFTNTAIVNAWGINGDFSVNTFDSR